MGGWGCEIYVLKIASSPQEGTSQQVEGYSLQVMSPRVSLCHPGWSAVVESRLTATSTSQDQAIHCLSLPSSWDCSLKQMETSAIVQCYNLTLLCFGCFFCMEDPSLLCPSEEGLIWTEWLPNPGVSLGAYAQQWAVASSLCQFYGVMWRMVLECRLQGWFFGSPKVQSPRGLEGQLSALLSISETAAFASSVGGWTTLLPCYSKVHRCPAAKALLAGDNATFKMSRWGAAASSKPTLC
ncbi:hypothetical protein AAY473_014754 [Plecturocebus cupreus]